jgi:hypothetical protein
MRILSLLFVFLLFGCDQTENTKVVVDTQNKPIRIDVGRESFDCFEWEHNGHKYLIIDRSNGSGITHSGECPCYGKTNKGSGGDFME